MSPTTAGDPARSAPLLLGAMLGSLVAGRFETAIACVLVAAVTAIAVGAGWPRRRWWGLLAGSALVAVALNAWLTPGQALPGPRLLGRAPSAEGLVFGGLLALRLTGAAVAIHGLRAAWPGERAADEAARWLRPLERLRLPVTEARAVLGLALRFAPLLGRELERITCLQDLRAGRRPRGLREWLTRRRAAVVPTFISALERAERVSLALEARHYRLRPLPAAPRSGWGWNAAGAAMMAVALLWRA